ncbi:hypothetical protein KVF89_22375 [Nocardioides carbamazepini]|uniref:hypothetical protein n=1 Tax=Nocardioides carbamazepini TaxID=2854259 RepID=UPI002149F86C|nr:hypothetical protein [Nocardioides carbamazepini]MCR1785303.1 hypothetical protein [Nocardioides carbamazepini]
MPASTPEYIRVRQIETGHQLSVPKSHAEATGGYEVLDKPAIDSAGRPLPPKYFTTLDPAADGKPDGYAAQTVKALKAEIAQRNDSRDAEHQLSVTGNKAALVAVLEADDAEQAEALVADGATTTPAAPAADSQPLTDGQQADTPKENA